MIDQRTRLIQLSTGELGVRLGGRVLIIASEDISPPSAPPTQCVGYGVSMRRRSVLQRGVSASTGEIERGFAPLKQLQLQTRAELDALVPSVLDKAFKGEL